MLHMFPHVHRQKNRAVSCWICWFQQVGGHNFGCAAGTSCAGSRDGWGGHWESGKSAWKNRKVATDNTVGWHVHYTVIYLYTCTWRYSYCVFVICILYIFFTKFTTCTLPYVHIYIYIIQIHKHSDHSWSTIFQFSV